MGAFVLWLCPVSYECIHLLVSVFCFISSRLVLGHYSINDDRDEELKTKAQQKVLVNWDRLHALTHGDKELEQRLARIFLKNMQRDIAELNVYYHNQEFQNWREVAHKIFGASAHIGALELARVSLLAETDFEDIGGWGDVQILHERILEQAELFQDCIKACLHHS